jgi:site-specific DNA recombinase
VSADLVEVVVWSAVTDALKRPEVLMEEYRRRLSHVSDTDKVDVERRQTALALKRVKAQEDRVTEAYVNEVMELDRYEVEMGKLKARRSQLEAMAAELDRRESLEQDSRRALAHLEAFCARVAGVLDRMTFEERQKLLQLVVERITIADGAVRIETIVPSDNRPDQLRTRHAESDEA